MWLRVQELAAAGQGAVGAEPLSQGSPGFLL